MKIQTPVSGLHWYQWYGITSTMGFSIRTLIWKMCVNGAVTPVSLFSVGSWGPQSCQWLVLPSLFLMPPLQHAPHPGLFAPPLFSLSYIFKFSLSNGTFSQNINILKNFLSSVLSPLSFYEELLEWISFIPFFVSSPHICYCSHDNRWSCY